jgi:hypothetical protein
MLSVIPPYKSEAEFLLTLAEILTKKGVFVINQYEMETRGNMSASWQTRLAAYNDIKHGVSANIYASRRLREITLPASPRRNCHDRCSFLRAGVHEVEDEHEKRKGSL